MSATLIWYIIAAVLLGPPATMCLVMIALLTKVAWKELSR